MIDIVRVANGEDLGLFNTDIERAKNILSVQIGELEYLPDFGIDLKYFLAEEFSFQNESFKSYLIQVLANYSVNVSSVIETVEALHRQFTFNIGNSDSNNDGMVSK